MKRALCTALVPVLACLLLVSCSEKQDFGQYDDLAVIPTVEASLLYIEAPERIINQVSGLNFVQQTFNFDAFAEAFVSERLVDGSVRYRVENTTSKPLELTVEFLDEAGNTLDAETFTIGPAPTAVLVREIAYGPGGRSIDIIRNTSSIRVSAENLGDNSSVSTLPNPMITLQSSAQFRIRLK
ncbi:hypothetical protein [Robiginitalea sediminis]|uniref:hypothetical protein n=1 Tax=Robiginitalea sediminis TaxID=1982593 RepID=UPI000B4B4920|nr:hypothetical protein [Robiginitalea sediminis]